MGADNQRLPLLVSGGPVTYSGELRNCPDVAEQTVSSGGVAKPRACREQRGIAGDSPTGACRRPPIAAVGLAPELHDGRIIQAGVRRNGGLSAWRLGS